jgi:hypothetical protein
MPEVFVFIAALKKLTFEAGGSETRIREAKLSQRND